MIAFRENGGRKWQEDEFIPQNKLLPKLREDEIYIGQGKTVKKACKQLEISEQTYYRWCREYGGMDITQAMKLREIEKGNTRLKKLVADLSLDNAILKEELGKK